MRIRTLEFADLNNIKKTAKELQTDGVARKEVNYRLQEAEEFLDETLNQSFSIGVNQQCWIQGQIEILNNITDFNSKLSEICDRVYHRSAILWNELINRRDLTSQGAKARRELIQAMLEHQHEERLGLEGYGPEVSMYYSLLEKTGIHRQEDDDRLLSDCQKLIYEGFGVRSQETKLREDLRVRANYLAGKCIESLLKRFIRAASDETKSDSQWLEALVMIVADKPAESWTDDDATAFEMKLADLVRRFKNLEALQKEVAAKGEGFEARRITMTRPDGQEIHQMVWVDHGRESQVEKIVDEFLSKLPDDQQLRQAILAKLSERILNADLPKTVMQIGDKGNDEIAGKNAG